MITTEIQRKMLFDVFENGFLFGAEIGMDWDKHPLTTIEAKRLIRNQFEDYIDSL